MAFEISFATPAEYEVKNIEKCLRAGFERVAVISEPKKLSAIRSLLAQNLPQQQLTRINLSSLENVSAVLVDFDAVCGAQETLVRGRKMKVQYRPLVPSDRERRKEIVSEIAARSIRRINRIR